MPIIGIVAAGGLVGAAAEGEVPVVGPTLIDFDFINEVYEVNEVSTTVAAIITTPGNVGASGLNIPLTGTPNTILGDAATILLTADWTLMIEFESLSTSGNLHLFSLAETPTAGFRDLFQCGYPSSPNNWWAQDDDQTFTPRTCLIGTKATGVHKMAITRTDSRMIIAVDGDISLAAASSKTLDEIDTATFGGPAEDTNGREANILSFAAYEPQTDAVLVALSGGAYVPPNIESAVGSAAGLGAATAISEAGSVGTASGIGAASAVGGDASAASSLLHFDGADASTTITDVTGHTWTAVGGAQLDTAQAKFGPSSLLLAGNYIHGDGSSDFTYGTGDFTIDCWVRFSSVAGDQVIYEGRPGVNGAYPLIYKPNTSNILTYYVSSAARITGTTVLTTGTWYHVAVTRSGTSTRLFLNGTQEGSTYTDSTNYLIGANFPRIGADNSGVSGLFGWIDEHRVLKGSAAWTSNFTPPASPY